MEIKYTDSIAGITPDHLHGFFFGWPNRPSPETHLKLLNNSHVAMLAIEKESGNVVGFATAVGDGVLCAYIPFLEVLPGYRRQGIGRQLVRRLLDKLDDLYMIDLLCDPALQSYYAQFKMKRASGMMIRNFARQSGRA